MSLIRSLLATASVCLLFIAQTNVAHAQEKLVIYGDSNHPLYAYTDENGKAAGIYADVLRHIADRMHSDFDIEIKVAPWKRVLTHAERGTAFAIFPPHYFPEKRPYLSDYSQPILEEQPILFCRKDRIDHRMDNWPEDFKHLKIGVAAGVKMGGASFWDYVDRKDILIDENQGVEANLLKMIAGRVDCHINDRLTIQWMMQQLLTDNTSLDPNAYMEVIKVTEAEHGYLALSKAHPASEETRSTFLTLFNKYLLELQAENGIRAIVEKHLTF